MAEIEYGLVMPFVTVQSVGGPHEDDSYVQGWAMGALDALLPTVEHGHEAYISPSSVPQANLLAMKHGFTFTAVCPADITPDWVLATFIRSPVSTQEPTDG